ncbi:MAG: YHYH protein [Pontiella sp.]
MKTRLLFFLLILSAGSIVAQRQMRKHTANSIRPIRLVEANEEPPVENEHHFHVKGDELKVTANGIPEHKVGEFPNRGNPHTIEPQKYSFSLPANPSAEKKVISLPGQSNSGRGAPNMPFGIGLNGVVMDPDTAEFWLGDRNSGWNYEALGGAVTLGIDENHAHVQPTGAYHYHGMPTGLLDELNFEKGKHSPQIGWAADGFPVYALYGYDGTNQSKVIKRTSSYRLKKGTRPSAPEGPGGTYDGSFVQDYEYVKGLGSLDECNGCFTVTPEFPDGTYAYFLTKEWPVIPRVFRGSAVQLRVPQHQHQRGSR